MKNEGQDKESLFKDTMNPTCQMGMRGGETRCCSINSFLNFGYDLARSKTSFYLPFLSHGCSSLLNLLGLNENLNSVL